MGTQRESYPYGHPGQHDNPTAPGACAKRIPG